jgi:citronellol/citronellal dehydrogenase
MRGSPTPETMAAAAYAIYNKPSRELRGRFLLYPVVLAGEGTPPPPESGVDPTARLLPAYFVSPRAPARDLTLGAFSRGASGGPCRPA